MPKQITIVRFFALLFVLVAVFQFTGCHNSSGDPELELPEASSGPGRPNPPPAPAVNIPLTGDISIGPNVGVVVGDELSATYTGPEVVSYQWFKDGVAIAGANGAKYTPLEAGIYTVEVSAPGYISKNSPAVTVIIAPGTPLLARSVITGGDGSYFMGMALDGSGNAYAVGALFGSTPYDFGNGVTAIGATSGRNPLIVKYNPDGVAQWARSVNAVSVVGNNSEFYAVAVDPSGDIYAVGCQPGTATHTYGTFNAIGASTSNNAVIVKYDPSGAVLWAKTPAPAAPSNRTSWFNGVAADASGAYVVGYQTGTASFNYNGASTPLPGAYTGSNAVLVKFKTDGTGDWARAASTGSSHSVFNAVALDSLGNVYAAGSQSGNSLYTYSGEGASGSSIHSGASGDNAVLVKFNATTGAGLWARSTSAGSEASRFHGVAVDHTGDVYAAGQQDGDGTYTYSGKSVSGSYGGGLSYNAVLVKYDSSTGTGQWAQSTDAGNNSSIFKGVAADSSGVYIAGYQDGNTSFTYGTVSVQGSSPGNYNILLLKLDHSGVAQWARSTVTGSFDSIFQGVAVGASGVWAAGELNRASSYTFGNEVSLAIGTTNEILLMKYKK